MTLWLLALAFVLVPPLVLRGRTLVAWYVWEVVSDAAAAIVWATTRPADDYLFVIVAALIKLTALALAIAFGSSVRWSASRAAMIAAVVYAFVIPTQMRTAIDGDEPYYLLLTESIVHDGDIDLSNQYRTLATSQTGRTDLRPQIGDPAVRNGRQYSRYEPFLPLLLAPGYLAGGLAGSLAVMALFGVLLVRSTLLLLEEEGIDERFSRGLFALFAFGTPVIFYATRIWPEVPGAFCVVEALRGIRQRRIQRWLPALVTLSLLKFRFVLVAVPLLIAALWRKRILLVGIAIVGVPLLVGVLVTGNAPNAHHWRELLPFPAKNYLIGGFGLLLDGAAGLLFQAPFYLAGIFAVARWRSTPPAFRIGILAALPYVISLIPRSEWHGGWSPPLRYIVVFMPVLLLGAAWMVERYGMRWFVTLSAIAMAGVTVHGLVYPWRMFHIANGENSLGEWLSRLEGSDFSRLFPSFIRVNEAAHIASLAAVAVFALFVVTALVGRSRRLSEAMGPLLKTAGAILVPLLACGVAWGFTSGRQPAAVIEFEDAHVQHQGGELYPEVYTVARFFYRGGWMMRQGDSLSFLAKEGRARLEYACATPVTIAIGDRAYVLPATGARYSTAAVLIPVAGRNELRCLSGELNVDRMAHE